MFSYVGDTVWHDCNSNGTQDPGESGVANVGVYLYNASGGLIGLTSTDPDGHYQFPAVAPGDYYIVFEAPYGYAFTTPFQGDDPTQDSDANLMGQTSSFTVGTGQFLFDIDAGLIGGTSIDGRAWNDTDEDGIRDTGESAFSMVSVRLLDSSGAEVASTATDFDGNYSFSNVTPGNYQVRFVNPTDYVFAAKDQGSDDTIDSDADTSTGRTAALSVDWNQDATHVDAGFIFGLATVSGRAWNDTNADGIQGVNEVGIANIQVLLRDSNNSVAASTMTDSSGNYQFTSVAPGTYQASFQFMPGFGYSQFGPQDQGGNDTLDSDVSPAGSSAYFTLVANGLQDDLDAGLVSSTQGSGGATIRGRAWNDANADGIQGASEASIAGILVSLYDASTNMLVASATTDSSGNYQFTSVAPGSYYVTFQFMPGFGYGQFSPQDQGGDDTLDSDVSLAGSTAYFTLLADGLKDHLDAGLVPSI